MKDLGKRILLPDEQIEDIETEKQLRPGAFDGFIGQENIVNRLKVAIEGAKMRKEQLDHILFCAPPGVGKTTLAYIITKELRQKMQQALGTGLKDSDAAKLFSPLISRPGILFLDELIKPSSILTTCICKAMEEQLLICGHSSVPLKPFTLIAASTDTGSIPAPLRDRFVHILHLNPYSIDELTRIAERSARILDIEAEGKSAKIIAIRSRGTPRIANRLLKICRNYTTSLSPVAAEKIMKEIGIDKYGLDQWDRSYLQLLVYKFNGGPVGLTTLSGAMQESDRTIETVLEPYILSRGLVLKTGKGRVVTESGMALMNQSRNRKGYFLA